MPARQPEQPEALRVRKQVAARDGIDVLGRENGSHDLQRLAAAVDHGGHLVAECEAVRLREPLVHERFLAASRVGPAAAPQDHIVQNRAAGVGHRDQAAVHRLGHPRHIERDAHHHAGGHLFHAGQLFEALGEPPGRPFGAGEDVGELGLGVVAVAGGFERIEADQRRHQECDARRHHDRDGERHRADPPQVAQQLPVECADHARSLTTGRSRRRPASR